MSFVETRLPDDIAYGLSGGPAYHTEVVSVASGYEHYNQVWSQALRTWDLAYVRTQTQLDSLIHFFHAVARGQGNQFRVKDWSDYAATAAQGRIGTGAVGNGTPGPHQLYKRYTAGGQTHDRKIVKPTATPATVVYKNAVAQTLSTHYTLDTTTGLVTWLALDTESVTGHTTGATHQFTTAADMPGLIAGEKVYLSGVTGTAATALNGLAHTINSKTGAGPYTWTLSTVTTGLTASGGTAAEYPQAADALTWAGEYDLPARFTDDALKYQMLESGPGKRMWSFPTLQVREVRL